MNRNWKTHDCVDLFNSIERGRLPLRIPSNYDLIERDWSVQLEPTWPASIPNDQENEMKFTIENGIEVPKINNSNKALTELRETLSRLEPTQSVFIPATNEEKLTPTQVNGILGYMRKKFPMRKFVGRKTFMPPFGTRVWRLE